MKRSARLSRQASRDLLRACLRIAKLEPDRAEVFLDAISEHYGVALVEFPYINRIRAELQDNVRISHFDDWILAYVVDDVGVLVYRILPARSNWLRVLRKAV